MNINFKVRILSKHLKSVSLYRNLATSSPVLPEKDGNLALFSLSNDIFYNLALEDHLAELVNKKSRNILLFWISEPCVVIGRHQNPWLECNVKEAHANSVKVVRRYSGGGCVYHDLGNLNMSFITNRQSYDRKVNLSLIKTSLERCNFKDIEFEISPRHDIFVRLKETSDSSIYKISGSAARLAQNFSYHHCTLLFNSQMERMKLLRSNLSERIVTKATPSVRSKTINLMPYLESTKNLDLEKIAAILCQEYWKLNHQNWSIENLFNYVNPEDENMSKILDKSLTELKSWEYLFGSTPRFSLRISFHDNVELSLEILSGVIKSFQCNSSTIDLEKLKNGLEFLVGCKLDRSSITEIIRKQDLLSLHSHFLPFLEFINKNFH